MTKSLILSSNGLQNVITNDEEYFSLRIGKQEIKLHKFVAEYLSPMISKLHRSDPTITHINYDDIFHNAAKENLPNIEQIITNELINKLYQLSKGYHIEINEEECFGMCVLSIILGNEEMFDEISKLFYFDSNKIDKYIDQLQYFHYFSHQNCYFDYASYIKILARNFYSIDKQKLLKLPKSILYDIISCKYLTLESEDYLFDIIQDIFENSDNEDEKIYSISDFYEHLDFMSLSSYKFREFMTVFDLNQINSSIWKKFSNYMLKNDKSNQFKCQRYIQINKQAQYNPMTQSYPQLPPQQAQYIQPPPQQIPRADYPQQQQQQQQSNPNQSMPSQLPQLPISNYQQQQQSNPNQSMTPQLPQIPISNYQQQQQQQQSNLNLPPNLILDVDEEVIRFLETKNLSEDQKQVFIRYHMQRKGLNLEQLYAIFEACDFNEDLFRSLLNSI